MPGTKDVAVLIGSLRKESFNRKLAMALKRMSPDSLRLDLVEIGGLPLYNQDLEGDAASPALELGRPLPQSRGDIPAIDSRHVAGRTFRQRVMEKRLGDMFGRDLEAKQIA